MIRMLPVGRSSSSRGGTLLNFDVAEGQHSPPRGRRDLQVPSIHSKTSRLAGPVTRDPQDSSWGWICLLKLLDSCQGHEMRIAFVINCHLRDLAERIHLIASLRNDFPSYELRVLTTAPLTQEVLRSCERLNVSVVSVSSPSSASNDANPPVVASSQDSFDSDRLELWQTFCADRHLHDLADIGTYATRNFSPEDLFQAFLQVELALDREVSKERVDLVISGAPDNYLSAMSIVKGLQQGIPSAYWGGADLCGPGRIMVYDTLSSGSSCMRVPEFIDEVSPDKSPALRPLPEPPKSDETIALFLDDILQTQPFANAAGRKASIGAHTFSAVLALRGDLGALRDQRRHRSKKQLLLETTEGTPGEALSRHLAWLARRRTNSRSLRRLTSYRQSIRIGKERVALVPLHYQPEAYVTFSAPKLVNQLTWLRLLCLSLPPDVTVLVKEHPLQDPGWRPARYYEEIASLPRVRLCAPDIPSRELLSGGGIDLVCTIGGSMCVEAGNVGVPVVTVLDSVVATFPGVTRADPFDWRFPQVLDAAIRRGIVIPGKDEVDAWTARVADATIEDGDDLTKYRNLIQWAVRKYSSEPKGGRSDV
jgi:hypothetical protein